MTPEQMRAAQMQSTASGAGVGKIPPEMKELLVRQAGEAAEAQTAADIDAHNAKIELRERHADEARQLGAKLAPPAHEKHPHKGKASK